MLEATEKRDKFITFWTRDNNYTERKLPARYFVINDCHHSTLGGGKIHGLADLEKHWRCYEALPRGPPSFERDILWADPELTFLLVGRGSIPAAKRVGQMPLFVWKEEGGIRRQDFGWKLEDRDYLFTRESSEYLIHTRGFEFSQIRACYFYKRCKILPLVFGGLVAERESSAAEGNRSRANLLKAFVNYTTGMFGLKGGKEISQICLASKLSHHAVSCLKSVGFEAAGEVAGKSYYLCKRPKIEQKQLFSN